MREGARRGGAVRREEFALDLEADHEEEEGHQPVVDPVDQGEGEVGARGADGARWVCQRS